MNFFAWGCTSDSTTLGRVVEYFSGSVTGSETARVVIDGTPALRYTVIGNDAGNQQMGAEVGLNTLPFNYIGGPALYYRWRMRIEPGFSWGGGTAKVKSSRTAVGPVVDGTPTGGQGYTGYVMSDGFLIGECDGAGCTVPGGGFNTDSNHLIPFDFRAVADGVWREYIVKVKSNSAVGVSDGEFEAWVNGVSVGSANGFILRNINPSTDPPSHVEGWGGWMTMPYFQLNGTAQDGGTIYATDFSVDDVYTTGVSYMPFPSESATPSLGAVYENAVSRAGLIKQRAQDLISRSLAGPIAVKDVGDFASLIADGNDIYTQVESIGAPLNTYAQEQTRTPTLDIVAEATALKSAISNVRNWLSTNYPRASSGTLNAVASLQEYTFDASFRRVAVTVTTTQTAGLRTQLGTITAAIS